MSKSRGSASSQEAEQVCHLLIHAGVLCIVGSSCRCLLRLVIGSERSETLALLTEAELVETLMYLHLHPMVGRLLADQVL